MLTLNVYGSSSKGNSFVIYDNERGIMIDCGTKNIYNKCDLTTLDGILITHSHLT